MIANIDRACSEDPKQPKISFNPTVVDPELQKRWDSALIDYAADSFSTFRQLSSPAFAELIKVANRKVKIKSRFTLSRNVDKKAKEILNKIVKLLKDLMAGGFIVGVAFTTDMWTSRARHSFLSLTVHYIDR